MVIGAPTALAGYAYQLSGGGSRGVLEALSAVDPAVQDIAGLVQSAGRAEASTGLPVGQSLDAGLFGLQVAAGEGDQALQDLLNPPLGYANPFLNAQGLTDSSVVAAYAAYQYAQAQALGEVPRFKGVVLQAAMGATQTFPADLYASAAQKEEAASTKAPAPHYGLDSNGDGIVTGAEERSYVLSHPALSPMDSNYDGLVSTLELLGYGLQNPQLDPKDANFDGFVSGAEELAYALKHPELTQLRQSGGGILDLYT